MSEMSQLPLRTDIVCFESCIPIEGEFIADSWPNGGQARIVPTTEGSSGLSMCDSQVVERIPSTTSCSVVTGKDGKEEGGNVVDS